MSEERLVVLEITRIEATHLAGLVVQFLDLLDDSAGTSESGDPAIARLVPDAYRGDAVSAREFREVTETDLLGRRTTDSRVVLETLGPDAQLDDDSGLGLDDPRLEQILTLALDAEQVRAWMRTLAAIRLVIATRLGIVTDDDHDEDDSRFGIYDWLGFRLDGLVRAATVD
ncbi:DUF2017 family protein [Microbacterium sp. P03]|uniref:DUF2017 family protein n=1 Tax=Microbacterium sp. P03 TaxID=3366946 RepID=UPI00374638A0